MKKLVANLLALVGGTITSLMSILLLGSLLSLSGDNAVTLSEKGQPFLTSPGFIMLVLLAIGIAMFVVGLRQMRALNAAKSNV